MKYLVLIGMLALSLSGCGGTGSSGAKITTSVKLASDRELQSLILGRGFRGIYEGGQVTPSGLESLKYYIRGISLCENLEIHGSGFSNPTHCMTVYDIGSEDADFAYDVSEGAPTWENLAEVARTHDDRFTDLMDATQRAKLTNNVKLSAENIGTYQWGFINWYPVVKTKASISAGGHTYRTIDGVADTNYTTTSAGNFTSAGNAEEAVVVLGNGGSWFKAQAPLEITQADIDTGTNYAVDLTFNPDSFFKAYSSDVSGCGTCQLKDAGGNQFSVPMLSLIPVLRKVDESTTIETYLASVSGTDGVNTDNFDLRIEVYYAKGDASKAIRGVGTNTLITDLTNTFVYDYSKVGYVSTANDGSIELQDYSQHALVSGFQLADAVNGVVTATLHCNEFGGGGFNFKGCAASETKDVSFTLTKVSELK